MTAGTIGLNSKNLAGFIIIILDSMHYSMQTYRSFVVTD